MTYSAASHRVCLISTFAISMVVSNGSPSAPFGASAAETATTAGSSLTGTNASCWSWAISWGASSGATTTFSATSCSTAASAGSSGAGGNGSSDIGTSGATSAGASSAGSSAGGAGGAGGGAGGDPPLHTPQSAWQVLQVSAPLHTLSPHEGPLTATTRLVFRKNTTPFSVPFTMTSYVPLTVVALNRYR